PGIGAQPVTERFVSGQAEDRMGERGMIAWFDQDGSLAVDQHLGHLSEAAGYDRPGHRQILEQLGRRAEVGAAVGHLNVVRYENIASVQVSRDRGMRNPAYETGHGGTIAG